MNFHKLTVDIQQLSAAFRQSAILAVNRYLTIRNWLIGFYIVKFEQNGEDRAKYGAKLLQNLAGKLKKEGEGFSYQNLNLFRQFYLTYPQIRSYLPAFFQENSQLTQIVSTRPQLSENSDAVILQTASGELQDTPSIVALLPAEKVIHQLSFSHITLLLPIDNPLKRLFYELECIKGTWSVRELKRQIDSLYFERSNMSSNPNLLSMMVQSKSEPINVPDVIKSPFVFDFLGLKSKDIVYESDLEQVLIEHLEEFLMELGDGFCFEARQKRIIIGGEYYFCDLVFYHRILKCHVLIELKVGAFSYEHIGQLKTYVHYYKQEVMHPEDNPPVGILLVTDKNSALVEYATADSDKDIFVSKYIFELPTKEQLVEFLTGEYLKL